MHSTSELLRTLSMMAASKPTSWLFLRIDPLSHSAIVRVLSCGSGLFPSRRRSLAPAVSLAGCSALAFAVWLESVTSTWPLPHPALYLQGRCYGGCTSIHFGENQLSPCSVGISPLPTSPPPVLQHWWVRASTTYYRRFTLLMGSSHGFGSHRRYDLRSSHSVALWLPLFSES
jgi:hypothetical protein